MIKTALLNMSVDTHRVIYEDLLNRAKVSRDIRIMEAKDNWDREGHLKIFLVYDEVDPKVNLLKQQVKLSEEEFPSFQENTIEGPTNE